MDIYDKLRIAIYISEIAAAITGFLCWNKVKNSYWKWFPVYLAVISAMELTVEWMYNMYPNHDFNMKIHEYFGIPLQFLFFIWLFNSYFRETKRSPWPPVCATAYIISIVADQLFFKNKQLWFLSFSYSVGNIALLVLAIIFFARLMISDSIVQYTHHTMFWVALGVLIFYLGSFPLYGLYNTMATNHPRFFNLYWIISAILDCIMYGFFVISFSWGRPK